MTVEQTSLDAYSSLTSQTLGERQRQVLRALMSLGEATNSMISRASGIPINVVTPRVLELRQARLVIEARRDFCKVTGRYAIYWKISDTQSMKGGYAR